MIWLIKLCVSIAFLIVLIDATFSDFESDGYEEENLPQFSVAIPNATVAVGRDAQLPCNIENLSTYKVAWLRVEDKGILTIHDHIITRNYRISLMATDSKQFTLLIKNVQESDRGGYMCQINTVPMRSQVGYLDVVFPPQILVNETSSDVVAAEGSNVTLSCKARGYPTPQIQWKREDKREIPLQTVQGRKYGVQNLTGETLTIQRVTRVHMGALLCIATNGIQPSVSRRVFLNVHFPPAVWIPNQSIGAPIGYEVTLNCHIEAYPASVNYWLQELTGNIIETGDKYSVQEETKEYKTHMTLTIRSLDKEDLSGFRCLAKNVLGQQERTVKLHEISGRGRSSASSVNRRQYSQQQKDGHFQGSKNSFASSHSSQSSYTDGEPADSGHRGLSMGLAAKTAVVCLTTAFLGSLF